MHGRNTHPDRRSNQYNKSWKAPAPDKLHNVQIHNIENH